MIYITKAARKFVKKSLRQEITLKAVKTSINQLGYTVIFYKNDEENFLIERYQLTDYSKTVRAFTVSSKNLKLVFVQATISNEDKLRALLHEVGHIVLGHMDIGSDIADTRLQDMQAEAFAYRVLKYKKDYKKQNAAICAVFAIIITITSFLMFNAYKIINSYNNEIETTEIEAYETVDDNVDLNEIVYITKTGSCYHRKHCRYIENNKMAEPINKETAIINYRACEVCNP